jgi:hypothetical protein
MKVRLNTIVALIILLILSIVWFIPLYALIVGFIKSLADAMSSPLLDLPRELDLGTILRAFNLLTTAMINTAIVVVPATFVSVLLGSIAAFAIYLKAGRPIRREAEAPLLYRVFRNPATGFVTSIAILFATVFTAFAINTGFPLNVVFEAIGASDLAEAIERYSISGLTGSAFDAIKVWIHSSLDNDLISYFAWGFSTSLSSVNLEDSSYDDSYRCML